MSYTMLNSENSTFSLTLTYKHKGTIVCIDKLEDKDLVRLLAQFQLIIANVCTKMFEQHELDQMKEKYLNDDITF